MKLTRHQAPIGLQFVEVRSYVFRSHARPVFKKLRTAGRLTKGELA